MGFSGANLPKYFNSTIIDHFGNGFFNPLLNRRSRSSGSFGKTPHVSLVFAPSIRFLHLILPRAPAQAFPAAVDAAIAAQRQYFEYEQHDDAVAEPASFSGELAGAGGAVPLFHDPQQAHDDERDQVKDDEQQKYAYVTVDEGADVKIRHRNRDLAKVTNIFCASRSCRARGL